MPRAGLVRDAMHGALTTRTRISGHITRAGEKQLRCTVPGLADGIDRGKKGGISHTRRIREARPRFGGRACARGRAEV